MRIEIHMLQNFAPANLNRDDTNSPKDCEFGGYRRARISSQCQKRAVRWHPDFRSVVEDTFARRSNMHGRQIAQILAEDHQKPFEEAYNVGRYMFQRMGFKEKNERLTVMLLLGGDEVATIASAAADNWTTLVPLSSASLLRERLATQLAGYLADLGEDTTMLARLIAHYKAGTANASVLQKWLDLPKERWSTAISAIQDLAPEFLTELREKYNLEPEEAGEDAEESDSFVPKGAANLFKGKKNKELTDRLKEIDIRVETGREAGTTTSDRTKKELMAKLKTIFTPLQRLTTKAVNVAMFGRMVAEIKDGAMTVHAACQVAHAISTHRVAMESDYFTAMEELKELAQAQGVGQDVTRFRRPPSKGNTVAKSNEKE